MLTTSCLGGRMLLLLLPLGSMVKYHTVESSQFEYNGITQIAYNRIAYNTTIYVLLLIL